MDGKLYIELTKIFETELNELLNKKIDNLLTEEELSIFGKKYNQYFNLFGYKIYLAYEFYNVETIIRGGYEILDKNKHDNEILDKNNNIITSF